MAFRLLFTEAQLTARVSETKLKQALDDDNEGDVHAAAVDQLITDASSYILETYYGTFESVPDVVPPALSRLALDAAVAYLGQRAPEVFRIDWERLFRWIDAQLKRLKQGESRVGETPPDPAANHGGEVSSTNPNDYDPPTFTFLNGMGIF